MDDSTKKKLLVATFGIGALLLINRAVEAKQTVDGLTFSFGIGGTPSVSGLNITFPVKVNVTNPNDVTLPLQGVGITLERLYLDGSTKPLAATNPAGVPTPNIAKRAVTSFVVPIKTDFISAITEVIAAIKTGGLGRYVLRPTIVSAGVRIPLPAQTITY
jgi:hypothetical protein